MSELKSLISNLEKGIKKNSSYVCQIKYPNYLLKCLKELGDVIGNEKVKNSVARQINYIVADKIRRSEQTNNSSKKREPPMLNTVLCGPPGVGKTQIGMKLAKIWYSLGFLLDGVRKKPQPTLKEKATAAVSEMGPGIYFGLLILFLIMAQLFSMGKSVYQNYGAYWVIGIVLILLLLAVGIYYWYKKKNIQQEDAVNNESSSIDESSSISKRDRSKEDIIESNLMRIVSRSDFVGPYQGWTDRATMQILESSVNKVLFVDEAYSLLNDTNDTFGKQALDCINRFMSERAGEIIIIFAGYRDKLEETVFREQPGLKRRFMWYFESEGYNIEELFEIFKSQLGNEGGGGMSLSNEKESLKLFRENKDAFPAYGGDTQRLAFFCCLEASKDGIKNGNIDSFITPSHIKKGIESLKENLFKDDFTSKTKSDKDSFMDSMMQYMKGKNKKKRSESDITSSPTTTF